MERDAGIDIADLADEQHPVRHILKTDSDDALLTAVCQEDRFGGLDDGVPICRVHLLQNIGAAFQPGPNGGAVPARHLLADDGSASARGATQVAQLEGAAGQGFMGHTVVLLNDDGIERHIFKGDCLALAAMEDDLLGGGFFHLESRGGPHLGDGVLSGIEPLALLMKPDLALGIGQDLTEVDGAGGLRRLTIAGVSHMKKRPLDGSASNTVFLVDSQLRGLPIFEGQRLFFPRIERNGLLPVGILVRQIVRGRNRHFYDLIAAGDQPELDRAILASGHIAAVIVVDTDNAEHSIGDLDRRIIRIHLGDGQFRLLQVVEYQFSAVAGAKVNGLGGGAADHIGVRDRDLGHGIAVHGDAGQGGLTVGAGDYILMVAVLDALDLKMGARNAIAGLLIPLEDGEIRQPLIHSSHPDCAATIYCGLIHMGNDRLCQDGVGLRDGNLNEGIHTLGHIGDGDDAIPARFFRCDELSILQDMEHRTG